MASLQQLETALINADKAGDTQAATMLAQEIQKMRSVGPSEIPGPRAVIPRPFETISNIPRSGLKFGGELVEAVLSPIETVKGIGYAGAGGMRNIAEAVLPEKAFNWLKSFEEDPEAINRAVATANAVGKDYANAYGSLDRIRNTIEQDPVRAASDLSVILGLTGKVASIARAPQAAEALTGAARVVDPLALPLAGANKLAEVAAPSVAYARNALSPQYRMLEPALEGRGEQYVSALMNAPREIVPGSPRTAGEILTGERIAATQLPALEQRVVSRYEPTRLAEMEAARTEARQARAGEVAGTPKERATAEAIRTAATEPLYEAAKARTVPTDEAFVKLMQLPIVQKAVPRAKEIAANEQRPFVLGETRPAQEVPSKIMGPDGQPMMTKIPEQFSEITGQTLQDIKFGIDAALKDPTNPLAGRELAAAMEARKNFIDWMEKTVPEFGEARPKFERLSKPIDEMDVAAYLKNKLVTPGEPSKTQGRAFAKAMVEEPKTLKAALGNDFYTQFDQVITKENAPKLREILRDIETSTEYKKLAQKGAEGASGIEGITARGPQFINKYTTIANRMWETLKDKINQGAAMRIAEAAFDPKLMAELIQEVEKRRKQSAATEASIRATSERITNAMRGKAPVLNVLSIQPEYAP